MTSDIGYFIAGALFGCICTIVMMCCNTKGDE